MSRVGRKKGLSSTALPYSTCHKQCNNNTKCTNQTTFRQIVHTSDQIGSIMARLSQARKSGYGRVKRLAEQFLTLCTVFQLVKFFLFFFFRSQCFKGKCVFLYFFIIIFYFFVFCDMFRCRTVQVKQKIFNYAN